jgi:hypothetical protein
VDSLRHALAPEAVERPEEHEIELTARGVGEELGEYLPIALPLGAAFVLDILAHGLVPLARTPSPELQELVLRILALIVGRDPGRGWQRTWTWWWPRPSLDCVSTCTRPAYGCWLTNARFPAA